MWGTPKTDKHPKPVTIGVPQGFAGAPEGQGCPGGALGCRFPLKAIGVLRGVRVPQGYGVPRVCGAGMGAWLCLAARLGLAWQTGWEGHGGPVWGAFPAAPPNRKQAVPAVSLHPPKPQRPPPLYQWGN